MDINSVTRDYAQCISNGAITEPTGGTWVSAAAIYLGQTSPVNNSWLQALCLAEGVTAPVNSSWVIALANHYGVTQPVNGSWWYAIADDACNGAILPIANFTSDSTTIVEGQSIQFTDTSTVPVGGAPITQWSWVFTGGTPSTSSTQNPSVVYNTVGQYQVALTVTNADGSNTKTVPNYITVNVIPVVADFTADTTTPAEGGTVVFTDTSTGTPTQWSWTFEGGTPATSTDQNPSIVYNTVGDYDVTLVASKTGSAGTELRTDYIAVSALVPVTPITEFDTDVFFNTITNPISDVTFATSEFALKLQTS